MENGLLGFDPAQLQQLMQQFGATEAEKKDANKQALFALGFGLLGGRRGQELSTIGQAGMGAMKYRQGLLDDMQKQKIVGLQGANMALTTTDAMRKMAEADQARKIAIQFGQGQLPGTQAPIQPTGGVSPQLPPSSIAPGSALPMTTGFDTASMPSPGVPASIQQQQGPQMGGTNKRALSDYYGNLAQKFQAQGLVDAANQAHGMSIKYLPKLKEQKTLMQNGKRVTVNIYEDGTQEVLPNLSPDQEKAHFLDTGATVGAVDPFTGKPIAGGGMYNKVITPGEQLSSETTRRGQNMTDARARDLLAAQDNAPLSQAAIEAAAGRYNIDGTLPPMGIGKNARSDRRMVLERAAEIAGASGLSGTDQRIQQIGNKANTASLSKLTQQATMVGAFEKTFNKNADLVLEFSQKTDNSGVPIINKWINAGKRSVVGDPQLSAFDVAVKSASNEYAKIISGSMGNTAMAEGEIKKVESLLNAAQTPAQVKEVVAFMRRETQNRMKGFEEQTKEIKDRMRGGGQSMGIGAGQSDVRSQADAILGIK